ncbi:hypothetical protein Clacol_007461 [Clathrus columnatus]|uniref:Uncharacterized protein n=1 Tax=Clathrus columnatus TaxID=1419009 RepID=A0AAV5AMQ5_9AGAM|nr:hypothetical protein Clacol_007461 [Clathrus columnatus]
MSVPSSSPSLATSPLVSVVYVITLFDPRRWVGAIFAILGVVASIVVPSLPARISKRLVRSETTVVPRRHGRNTSQIVEGPSFAQRLPHPRSITPEPSPRTYPSTPISQIDPSPPINFRRPGNANSGSSNNKVNRTLTPVLSPACIYRGESRRSLESLDLATPANPSSVTQAPHTSTATKVTFHIPHSQRRASTDYCQYQNEDETIPKASETHAITGLSELGQYMSNQPGDDLFAVKRSAILLSPKEPLSARRKFSLFSRDRDAFLSSRFKDSISPASQSLSSDAIPFEPTSLSSPSPCHNRISPLSDSSMSPAALSFRSHEGNTADTTPTERFSIPPERPRRTDPYKKFNIPVPGTERARAFLKAEKEWVKAETQRREQGRSNKVLGGAAKHQASTWHESNLSNPEIPASKRVVSETERSQKKGGGACYVDRPRLKRRSFSSRKSSSTDEEALPFTGPVESGNETDVETGDNRDGEGHRPMLATLDIPIIDEIGTLHVPLSAVPEEDSPVASSSKLRFEANMSETLAAPRPSVRSRRAWVFLKRPESQDATARKLKEERTENSKSKRPKSRETKVGLPFGSGGKKEKGYVSDTAVTSITYQLM